MAGRHIVKAHAYGNDFLYVEESAIRGVALDRVGELGGGADQGEVALVQRTHRRHQADDR